MSLQDFDTDKPWPVLQLLAATAPSQLPRARGELLEWMTPEQDMPDAEVRVLLWLRQPDGSTDWDVGHWDGETWLLDWCGAAPDGQVVAWAQPEGPDL